MTPTRRTFTASWSWSVAVNPTRTWRERLGMRLRVWADRLDGGTSMAFTITTVPPLSQRQRLACLAQGTGAVMRAVRSECVSDAHERVMQQAFPELYERATR